MELKTFFAHAAQQHPGAVIRVSGQHCAALSSGAGALLFKATKCHKSVMLLPKANVCTTEALIPLLPVFHPCYAEPTPGSSELQQDNQLDNLTCDRLPIALG